MEPLVRPVSFSRWELMILDQTLIPFEERYLRITELDDAIEAIKQLKVRGAPAIGIAAAYSFVLGIKNEMDRGTEENILKIAQSVKRKIENSRPTAVNLFNALNRMFDRTKQLIEERKNSDQILDELVNEANMILEEDLNASRGMISNFLKLFEGVKKPLSFLTHCNTGALATGGLGTALGAIRAMYEIDKVEKVFATETRPLLQGARLTAWELEKYGIPYNLIVDSAAPYLISKGMVDAVVVGADRVARNGDTANKIGTLSLALAAKEYDIPFIVVCPSTSLDLNIEDGSQINIEYRSSQEVGYFKGERITVDPYKCLNPAFDVTPHQFITAIVFETEIKLFREMSW
ncbi:MAG: S-methyl-5-thioribose-1-phosphate isomerase [Actinobacteria bacterium]|nr:S-methyl-5-thioribose-1-phosphate isomerase [Actinomycetota bacterium]